MFTKQKIKKLTIISILMIIFSISLIFYSKLNPFLINLFADKFNIVSNRDNMLVHFINVGQGDAVAINLPDGKVMLIDTGSEDTNSSYVKYLKENVVNTKKNNYIDYLVLSHADMDHVGGTMKLLKNFRIGTIYMPKVASDSEGYIKILNHVENGCEYVTLGQEFEIETQLYTIMFYEVLNEANTNDSSQVIRLECYNKSFLFVGDISENVEHDYVERYGEMLDVDVLKVAHHGSNDSTCEEFLRSATPECAVISVGEGNSYGHPTYDVLQRLKENNIKILRTDKDKDVLFVVGKSYGLKQLNGVYYITGFSLNYAYIIFIIDSLLILAAVFVIAKKEKQK